MELESIDGAAATGRTGAAGPCAVPRDALLGVRFHPY